MPRLKKCSFLRNFSTGIAITNRPPLASTRADSCMNRSSGRKCCADSSATTLSTEPLENGSAVEVAFTKETLAPSESCSCEKLMFTQATCSDSWQDLQYEAGAPRPLPTSITTLAEASSASSPTCAQSICCASSGVVLAE